MTKILPYTGVDDGLPRIRPEQEEAIQRMMAEPTKSIANGSNMDTGKTLQAAELVIRLGLVRVLYIGVKDTYAQWAGRLADQSDGAITLRRLDSTKAGKLAFADFYAGADGHFFVGSQFLTAQDFMSVPELGADGEQLVNEKTGKPVNKRIHMRIFKKMKRPVDMIVFDEIHVIANRKSQCRRTLGTIATDWKVGMSGTWVGNKFENSWSITQWLWPDHIDRAFSRWRDEWCTVELQYFPGQQRAHESVSGEKRPGEFVQSLPCYIRLDGELEIPAPEVVLVDLLPEQRRDYDALEADNLVWLQSAAGSQAVLVTDIPIVMRSRLRTATLGVMSMTDDDEIYFDVNTKSTKLNALRGILDRPHWRTGSVAIYTDSKRFAKVTVARMQMAGYNAVEWSGDVDSKGRDAIKAAFLAGQIQYLVATIPSFSTGLDGFQSVCNKVVWLSESDNSMLNQQAIKRFFRTGRKDGFEHVKILARNTYDEGVFGTKVQEVLAMNASLSIRQRAA